MLLISLRICTLKTINFASEILWLFFFLIIIPHFHPAYGNTVWQFPVMMKMFCICLIYYVLKIWLEWLKTVHLNYLVLMNLNVSINNHLWLVVIILNSIDLALIFSFSKFLNCSQMSFFGIIFQTVNRSSQNNHFVL